MKSYFSRFLHHTMSYSGLTRISRWKNFANWFDLDTPIKSECDTLGKNASTGRSMVEMLGVLAIIGVLSVGAIAGYSKAMMKYKLNKQAEQISWLLNVAYRYRNNFGKKHMSLVPYFIKLGEIPENMIKDNSSYVYDIFGSKIIINISGCSSAGICGSIIMDYKTNSPSSFELCQNLTNIAKEFHDELSVFNVARYKSGADRSEYAEAYNGTKFCTNNKRCIRDITQEQIYELCRYCRDDDNICTIYYAIPIN